MRVLLIFVEIMGNKTEIKDLTIVNLLKAERKKRKISQGELSVSAGLSKSFYGHLESGRINLSAANMVKICQAMGIKVLLVNGENILKG